VGKREEEEEKGDIFVVDDLTVSALDYTLPDGILKNNVSKLIIHLQQIM